MKPSIFFIFLPLLQYTSLTKTVTGLEGFCLIVIVKKSNLCFLSLGSPVSQIKIKIRSPPQTDLISAYKSNMILIHRCTLINF